jgi:apolipoprotein N-acyltransferase
MVRAANTGVTCFVDRFGRVTQELKNANGTFMQGVLSGGLDVPTDRRLTFYVRHGELFAEICAGATLVLVLARGIQLARRKPSSA